MDPKILTNAIDSAEPTAKPKRVYVAPAVTDMGSVASLTRGNPGGGPGDTAGMMTAACL